MSIDSESSVHPQKASFPYRQLKKCHRQLITTEEKRRAETHHVTCNSNRGLNRVKGQSATVLKYTMKVKRTTALRKLRQDCYKLNTKHRVQQASQSCVTGPCLKNKLSVKVTKWVCGTYLTSFCTQTRKSLPETSNYKPPAITHYRHSLDICSSMLNTRTKNQASASNMASAKVDTVR